MGTANLNYHYEFKNGWLSHGEALDEHADVYVAADADDATHVLGDFRGTLDIANTTAVPKTSKKPFGWTQNGVPLPRLHRKQVFQVWSRELYISSRTTECRLWSNGLKNSLDLTRTK